MEHTPVYDYLKNIIIGLLSKPNELTIREDVIGDRIALDIQVNDDDAGQILGREGATIHAIRKLVSTYARRQNFRLVFLNVVNSRKR